MTESGDARASAVEDKTGASAVEDKNTQQPMPWQSWYTARFFLSEVEFSRF
jgi:hypothetical protein